MQGTISLNLKEVPWEQALNIITKSKGLAQRRDGSVILVAPIAEITRFEELEATAYTQSLTLSPLITKVIQLNYAKAKDVAEMLRAASASSVDQIDSGANCILAAAADDSPQHHCYQIVAVYQLMSVQTHLRLVIPPKRSTK